MTFGEEGFALMVGGKRVGTFEIDADGDGKYEYIHVHFLTYSKKE